MAMSKWKLTDNQMHYFILTNIVNTEFPKALRKVFKALWDNTYGNRYGPWDDSPAVRDLFLSLEGGSTTVPVHLSYEEWDTSILFHAIIHSRTFSPPADRRTLSQMYVRSDWDSYSQLRSGAGRRETLDPAEDETELETITLAVDQLHHLRNNLSRFNHLEVEKPMFDQYLLNINEAFQALGVSTVGLHDLMDSIENYERTSGDESSRSWIQGNLLGAGAFGKVYKCHVRIDVTATVLAVKIVKIEPHYTEDQKEVKAIKNEIDILRKLKHKRIVSYYGSEQTDSHLHLFMAFVTGGSLSDHIKKNKTLSESESRKYTRQMLEGVSFLHSQNIIHRDIKGSNVLLDGKGNAKLADFGLSKIIQKIGSKTDLVSYCGTPYWMAPDIILGKGYGRKADIWSVGCTVVEMLTGSPPLGHLEPTAAIFRIGNGSIPAELTLPEGVSDDAKEFILAALTCKPDDRPWSNELQKHNFVSTLSYKMRRRREKSVCAACGKPKRARMPRLSDKNYHIRRNLFTSAQASFISSLAHVCRKLKFSP